MNKEKDKNFENLLIRVADNLVGIIINGNVKKDETYYVDLCFASVAIAPFGDELILYRGDIRPTTSNIIKEMNSSPLLDSAKGAIQAFSKTSGAQNINQLITFVKELSESSGYRNNVFSPYDNLLIAIRKLVIVKIQNRLKMLYDRQYPKLPVSLNEAFSDFEVNDIKHFPCDYNVEQFPELSVQLQSLFQNSRKASHGGNAVGYELRNPRSVIAAMCLSIEFLKGIEGASIYEWDKNVISDFYFDEVYRKELALECLNVIKQAVELNSLYDISALDAIIKSLN